VVKRKDELESSYFYFQVDNGLLARLGVTITLHNTLEGYATSWHEKFAPIASKISDPATGQIVTTRARDCSIPIALELPTPPSFDIPADRDPRTEFRERNASRITQMKAKLAAALTEIPIWTTLRREPRVCRAVATKRPG